MALEHPLHVARLGEPAGHEADEGDAIDEGEQGLACMLNHVGDVAVGRHEGTLDATAGDSCALLELTLLQDVECRAQKHVAAIENLVEERESVALFLGVGALLVGGAIAASRLLSPSNPTATKAETYECGIDPVGGGWSQTQIRYYIFALLFLIFDVEAVFIFPWAIRLESFAELGMGGFVLVEMVIFIAILVLGLVYAIRKGVLRWE